MEAMPRSDADVSRRTEALRAQLSATMDHASPVAMPTRQRIVNALIALPAFVALVVITAGEIVYDRLAAGLEVSPIGEPRLHFVLAMLAILTASMSVLAVWRGRRGFGASFPSLAAAACLFVPIYLAVIAIAPAHEYDEHVWNISAWGTRCFAIGSIICTIALATLVTALRRAVPVATRLRGSVLGAAAGAWAGLGLFMFCPSADQGHLLVGHGVPVVLFTIIGMLLAPRLLRP